MKEAEIMVLFTVKLESAGNRNVKEHEDESIDSKVLDNNDRAEKPIDGSFETYMKRLKIEKWTAGDTKLKWKSLRDGSLLT